MLSWQYCKHRSRGQASRGTWKSPANCQLVWALTIMVCCCNMHQMEISANTAHRILAFLLTKSYVGANRPEAANYIHQKGVIHCDISLRRLPGDSEVITW